MSHTSVSIEEGIVSLSNVVQAQLEQFVFLLLYCKYKSVQTMKRYL